MRTRPGAARLLLAGLAAGLVLMLGTPSAAAHNEVTSTVPADGERVGTTPSSVVLTFSEPAIAMGTQIVVTGPTGDVTSGPPRLVDAMVAQDLQPGAPAGAYTVTWRATSGDGHPVSGTFAFTTDTAAPGSVPAGTPTPRGVPAEEARREPLVPSWGWIAAGVLVILGAVRLARQHRDD